MAERLTSRDMDIITRAIDLANAETTEDYRRIAKSKSNDTAMVRAEALGVAQYLLQELVTIVEGLASDRITGKGPRS